MKTSTLDTPRNTETSAFHVKQSDTRARSRAGTRCQTRLGTHEKRPRQMRGRFGVRADADKRLFAVAEDKLAFLTHQGGARLIAQVVHADEELGIITTMR